MIEVENSLIHRWAYRKKRLFYNMELASFPDMRILKLHYYRVYVYV